MARIVPMSPECFQMKALQFCNAAWHIPCVSDAGKRLDAFRLMAGQGRLP